MWRGGRSGEFCASAALMPPRTVKPKRTRRMAIGGLRFQADSLGDDLAKRMAARRLREHFGEGRAAEGIFDRCQGVVESFVERAQPCAMGCQAERTFANPSDRFDGIDDFEDCQLLGRFR